MGRNLTSWAIDLDGVIWRGSKTVPGAPEAVARLRAEAVPIAFVTNSAQRTPAQVAAKLAAHGIPDAESEVITSAMAAATMIEPGERVLMIGSEGLRSALEGRGATVLDTTCVATGRVETGLIDTVTVGMTSDFDYSMMTTAMNAVLAGARFIATNTDTTFPAADGLLPGNGAIVASIATATGVTPEVAGKPHRAIGDLTRERLGADGIMVGDRAETDGLFAEYLGYEFGLVFSGVTRANDPCLVGPPAVTAEDLRALVGQRLELR